MLHAEAGGAGHATVPVVKCDNGRVLLLLSAWHFSSAPTRREAAGHKAGIDNVRVVLSVHPWWQPAKPRGCKAGIC